MFTLAYGASYIPIVLTVGTIIASLAVWWSAIVPRFAVGLLLLSLFSGQIIRVPLPGQGGGVLVSDAAVVLVLVSALVRYLKYIKILKFSIFNFQFSLNSQCNNFQTGRSGIKSDLGEFSPSLEGGAGGDRRYHLPFSIYHLPITIFLFLFSVFIPWSIFTLIIHVPELGIYNSLIAGSYWIRLSAYVLLFPALLVLLRDKKFRVFTERSFLVVIMLLVLAGFLQTALLSNVADLPSIPLSLSKSEGRWDPHEGRLVSTWLDPNFFGMFLVFALLYITGRCLHVLGQGGKKYHRSILISQFLIFSFSFLALLLTQSRSGIGALVLSLLVLSPLVVYKVAVMSNSGRFPSPYKGGAGGGRRDRSPFLNFPSKFSLYLFLFSISGLLLVFGGLIVLILGDRAYGILQVDETMQLRLEALQGVWVRLAEPHSLLGVGYNAYQFAAQREGLIGAFTIHSRAGADSSLLTLWVTTGIPGVLLFLYPFVLMFMDFIKRWTVYAHIPSITAAVAILALLIHSSAVNSLLYGHLLITLSIIVALAQSDSVAIQDSIQDPGK